MLCKRGDKFWHLQKEMGIAPLGHRQGLLMAIADLAAFNGQTHGDSLPQHSGLTIARTRGRPQTAPSARGSSPGRPRSAGSVSPDRGLKVLSDSSSCSAYCSLCKQVLRKCTMAGVTAAVHACPAFCCAETYACSFCIVKRWCQLLTMHLVHACRLWLAQTQSRLHCKASHVD